MDAFAFVKPKSRKRNSKGKLFTEDLKYAEADKYSEVGAASEASFNKYDAAESIVGFFGDDEKKRKYKEGSEVTNYDEDIFSDEEFEDNELEDSDHESMSRVKIERLLKDQAELEEKKHQKALEESTEVNFVDNHITFKRTNTYELYQKCVESLVKETPEARDTFFKAKTNAEWEIKKTYKLKKRLNKKTRMHEEFLEICERKLILSMENGSRKKIPGLSGSTQVYTCLRPPPVRETQTLEEIVDYPDLFEKSANLCNENMELTLADEAGDGNVIRSDFDISEMELDHTELDDEVSSTASDTKAKADQEGAATTKSQREDSPQLENSVDSKQNIQTLTTKLEEANEVDDNVLNAAASDVHMDLTAIDAPRKVIEDDEESTASDLEFFVNEEVKRLQKIHKIPNDFLRFLYSNDEPELQTEEDVEAENEKEEAIATLGGEDVDEENEEAVGEEDEEVVDEEAVDEEDDEAVDEEDDEVVEEEAVDKEDEEAVDEEDDEFVDEEEDEEEESEEEEEQGNLEVANRHREEKDLGDQDENRGSASPHDRGDCSSTTGSVLSEIQNTLPGVGMATPPEFHATREPGGDQRRRMILPCVGIPREKLPHVRIVMVPTIDIIRAYAKLDEEMYRMTHAPDGTRLANSEEILARFMQQGGEI